MGTLHKWKAHRNMVICLLLNMVLNLDGTIPAWILLALHIWLDLSIWWFWLALGVWFLIIVLRMMLFAWANRCATPDRPKENKNPYSVGNNTVK